MIILTSPEQFKIAAKRAKELKPRVWSNVFGTYFVEGQAQDYKVQFGKVDGQFAGSCTCPAHTKGTPKPCYHLASAYLSHKIQVSIRRQVKAYETPSIADWTVGMEAA